MSYNPRDSALLFEAKQALSPETKKDAGPSKIEFPIKLKVREGAPLILRLSAETSLRAVLQSPGPGRVVNIIFDEAFRDVPFRPISRM